MKRIINLLNGLEYKKLIWLLVITETVHNSEEAIWLPSWSHNAGIWHPKVGKVEFWIADIFVTLLMYSVFFYFSKKENTLSRYLMGGAMAMILFNVFMPHLLAAAVITGYMPGLITGLLLNVPVILYLMHRGLKEGIFKVKTFILGGLGFTAAAYPLLQLLFYIGRAFNSLL